MNTPTTPTDNDFFADLDDREFDAISSMDEIEIAQHKIRKGAHIANGGEATFDCPACKGTGRWGYSGRPCFKCKSTGKVSSRVAGAAKAAATKHQKILLWQSEHKAEVEFVNANREWSGFFKSLDQQITDTGTLSERQIEAVRKGMAQAVTRKEAFEQARLSISGPVNLSAVHALFTKATDNGYKRPIFRSETVTVKMARRHENVLYVTDTNSDEYLGKIVNGEYKANNAATAETINDLRMICDDPEKALYNYSRSTATYDADGNMISCGCGICGKELTDPTSMARGIGPICAGGFGL